MKKYFFIIPFLVYVFLGAGHIIGHVLVIKELAGSEVYRSMKLEHVRLIFMARTVYQFLNGFSLTMGFFMIAFGALNLLYFRQFGLEILLKKPILYFNAAVALGIVILSCFFFTWPPIIFFSLATVMLVFLAFTGSLKNSG